MRWHSGERMVICRYQRKEVVQNMYDSCHGTLEVAGR
jgi:hypothetical protein